MGEDTPSKGSRTQALLLLPLRIVRLPFDLLFLTWDFLLVTVWGIQNLPARLLGAPQRPFRPRFEGGIIEERHGGTLWYCPLAPKYGTKSLLRLLFPRLVWHASADGRPSLCWHGSASNGPTTWPWYLLTALLLALVWAGGVGALAWRFRGHLSFGQRLQAQASPTAAVALRNDPARAAQFVAQALALERDGKPDEARARFRDAVARDSTCQAAHLGDGRLCLSLGLTDDARAAFAKALELNATDPQAMLGMARVLHAQGADRKALELLQAAVARSPDVAAAHALQATCLLGLGDIGAATTAIERALELAPGDEATIATAAELELRQGHLDKAETYYRRLVDRNVENLVGRIGLARLLRIKGNARDAEVLLRALLVEKPGELQATEELIDVLLASGRPQDGLALCRQTIDRTPAGCIRLREKQLAIFFGLGLDNELYVAAGKLLTDSPGNLAAHTQLAAMFLRKGLPALAIDHCAKALAQQPGMENVYRLQVAALLQAGDTVAAKERLERLLAVLPQDLDAIIKLAECLRRQGDTGKAVELLRQGVEFHPGSSAARSQLAHMAFLAGDTKGALAEFREAHRLAPDDPKSLNNLAAAINYADGDLKEALVYAEQARRAEPYNAQILDTLAWVHRGLGDTGRALSFSEMAVALQPELPILRYHHGAILAALGKNDEAKESLKAALRPGVEFHGTTEARALLLRLSGGAPAAP